MATTTSKAFDQTDIFNQHFGVLLTEVWRQLPCPFAPYRHQTGTDRRPSAQVREVGGQIHFYCHTCKTRTDEFVDLAHQLSTDDKEFEALFEAVAAIVPEQSLKAKLRRFALAASGDSRPKIDMNQILNSGMGKQEYQRVFKKLNATSLSYLSQRIPGLLSNGNVYDLRFDPVRNRLVFPAWKPNGNSIAVCVGRDLTGVASEKYYNYKKEKTSKVFGGYYPGMAKPKHFVICEGFFDLLRLAHYFEDSRQVLCTFGTNMSEDQVAEFPRNCLIEIWYDGDEAGRNGAIKARSIIQSNRGGVGVVTRIVNLPEGKDPGSLTSKEIQHLTKGIKNERRTTKKT